MSTDNQQASGSTPLGFFGAAFEYMTDAAQRSVLFCDVMRQRGNQYRDHLAETVPNVLDYKAELVMDGRTLKRPVNYLLVALFRRRELISIPLVAPLSCSILVPDMVQVSAASRRTVKSGLP